MSTIKKEKHTENFLMFLNKLLDKGVTQSAISNQLGLHRNRISHIKAARSSATKEMIDDLLEAYPELRTNGNSASGESDERWEELERRVKALEDENAEQRKIILRLATKALKGD